MSHFPGHLNLMIWFSQKSEKICSISYFICLVNWQHLEFLWKKFQPFLYVFHISFYLIVYLTNFWHLRQFLRCTKAQWFRLNLVFFQCLLICIQWGKKILRVNILATHVILNTQHSHQHSILNFTHICNSFNHGTIREILIDLDIYNTKFARLNVLNSFRIHLVAVTWHLLGWKFHFLCFFCVGMD